MRDPKKAVEAVLREWAPADLTQGDSYPLSPLSWEKLDDLILLPHDYYSREEFQRIEGGARKRGDLGELYTKISTALGGKGRLAVQHPIAANDHRRSQVHICQCSSVLLFFFCSYIRFRLSFFLENQTGWSM